MTKNTDILGSVGETVSSLGINVGENTALGKLMQIATIAQTAATWANTIAQSTSEGGSIVASIFGLANGGVMSNKGFTPLANGGYATQATPYLVGEGRKNEAVVPLPNNREIPVELKGGGESTTVNNNYDFRGADAASEARIRRMIEANGAQTFNKVFSEMDRGGSYAKRAGRR